MATNHRIGERLRELASKPTLTDAERLHLGLLRRLKNGLGALDHLDIDRNDRRALLRRADKVIKTLSEMKTGSVR